jgi:hypothetical protein
VKVGEEAYGTRLFAYIAEASMATFRELKSVQKADSNTLGSDKAAVN